MRIYTVHESSGSKASGQEVLLVKEGFCWPALLFAPLWALWHRMWPVAFVLWAAYVALVYLPEWVAGGDVWARLGWAAMLAVMGFLGNDLRRWTLGLRGYDLSGVVGGGDLAEAERRLFSAIGPVFYGS